MENISWIVVADAGRASIFATMTPNLQKDNENIKDWDLIETLDHNNIHQKSLNNIPGETGSHNFGTAVDGSNPKKIEAANFAQSITFFLDKNRNDHKYSELVIVAPPHFMGLLNQHMPKEVHKLIRKTIDKDYTSENGRELVQRILSHLT